MAAFFIGSIGWDHPAWAGTFFPEELPASWRLPYYSNEFMAVLVPADVWRRAGPDEIEGWLDDTPARFRFFLEFAPSFGPGSEGTLESLADKAALLGGKLGGGVVTAKRREMASALSTGLFLARRFPASVISDGVPEDAAVKAAGQHGLAVCWQDGGVACCTPGRLVAAMCPEQRAPRQLRALVETLAQAAIGEDGFALLLCPGGSFDVDSMQQLKTITELLGW